MTTTLDRNPEAVLATRSLGDSDPSSGDVIVIDGRDWFIRESGRYATANGYEFLERECRNGHARAYLLREGEYRPRWLFAREVPPASVTLPSGEAFSRWVDRSGASGMPGKLVYRETIYEFATTFEGIYQDVEGAHTAKTTGEFRDAQGQFRLALERWPDGSIDLYHERYLSPDDVPLRPGGWLGRLQSASRRVCTAAGKAAGRMYAAIAPAQP